ncbi:Cacna1i, partial [Symbiodinium sp. CCMP2592]
MAATATTRPAKPRRKLDTAQREGIEQLLEHDKRHLLKVRDLQSKSQALLKPEDIQVVLYDVYSVDSFAACCVARKFLGLGVHYEGVTRGSCLQHLSLDAEGLDGKAREELWTSGRRDAGLMLESGRHSRLGKNLQTEEDEIFLSLLDRLREEHELQVNNLSSKIGELQKRLDTSGPSRHEDEGHTGTNSVELGLEDADKDKAEADGMHALRSGGGGSPKLQRKQTNSQFTHLGIHTHTDGWRDAPGNFFHRYRGFVSSALFETSFASLIVFNALVMAADVQVIGIDIGADLAYAAYMPTSLTAPWARPMFEYFEWFFGIAFTVEIVMKFTAFGLDFVKDLWNWIDTFIVCCWYIDVVANDILPINTTLLRLLRLVRLLRLLRLVRLIKTFDSLYLMTTALKGSALILTWACVLLLVLQILLALLLNQILYTVYFPSEDYPLAERLELFEYFGTFTRSMLSMFEITLGNWPPVCRLLSEKVSEWFMLLCVLHKLVIGFAVVGVINGVFIQETFKVASSDNQIMMRQKERSSNLHEMKMRQLFLEADND